MAALSAQTSVSAGTPRRMLAVYPTYPAAIAAIDELAAAGYPVEHLEVRADGMRHVEDPRVGSLSIRSALRSATEAASVAAVLGFFIGWLDWVSPLVSAFALALYGFALGAVVGLIAHTVLTGRLEPASRLEASRYEVIGTDEDEAAQRVLAKLDNAGLLQPFGSVPSPIPWS